MVQKVKIPSSKNIAQFFMDYFTRRDDSNSNYAGVPMLSYPRDTTANPLAGIVLGSIDVEHTIYLAVKDLDGNVGAVICPIHDILESKSRSIFDTASKWVSFDTFKESDNPNYVDCPQEIGSLLTPTTDENALRWRNRAIQKSNNIQRLRGY